jgi:predicted phage-related endonuclease
VYKDNELIDMIIEKADFFWRNNVLKDIPPDNSLPSMNFIKKIKRQPKSIADLTEKKILLEHYVNAKAILTNAEQVEEESKKRLLAELGTCEAGKFGDTMVTYLMQTRKGRNCSNCGCVVSQPCTFPVMRMNKKIKELTDGKK